MLRPADEIIMMILKPGALPTTRRLLLLASSLSRNLPGVFQAVFFSITVVRSCTWNLLRQFNSQPGFQAINFKTWADLPLGAGLLCHIKLWVWICLNNIIYSTASRHNNNNPSLVFLEFSNSYIIAMTLITRKRFILETFSYTVVIVQEMTELFTFCDKSIKLCMISTRHVKNHFWYGSRLIFSLDSRPTYVLKSQNLKKKLTIIFLLNDHQN